MINANQEEFLRMINEPAPQGGGDMADLAAQLAGAAGGGGTVLYIHTYILTNACWLGSNALLGMYTKRLSLSSLVYTHAEAL